MSDDNTLGLKRSKSKDEQPAEVRIAGLSGKTETIQIPNSENAKSVCGSINGIPFNIPRGKPVVVPVEVIEVLNNANVVGMTGEGSLSGYSNRFNAQILQA